MINHSRASAGVRRETGGGYDDAIMITRRAGFSATAACLLAATGMMAASPTDPQGAQASQPALAWHRSQLPCGARLIVIHAPKAKRQTTYSLLPAHLANDDADRAQWSHLLEHMLIRTTDAEGLAGEGVIFNGETTASYLRLETIAEPAQWKQSLERHAKWLTARTFDPQRLEREKGMIAGEEQNTSSSGFTGKFAIAAWNQAFIHGRPHAAVHGNVQQATIENVARYAASRVRPDSSALIASIGPIPVADVEGELVRLLGELKADPPATQAASKEQAATQPQTLEVTWDLPTRHVLWWWPLPDRRPQTLAAATGASRALMLRVRSRRDVASAIRSMQPHAMIMTERGPFMVIDACIGEAADPAALTRAVRECAAAMSERAQPASTQSLVFGARMAAQELSPSAGFEQMAGQLPPHLRDAVEGLWLLSLLNYEFMWNVHADVVYSSLMQLDDAAVADMQMRLRQEPGTLVLSPVRK